MTVSECKYIIQEIKKSTNATSEFVSMSTFSDLYDVCTELCRIIDETKLELADVIEEYESQIQKEQEYSKLYQELLKKTNDALCNMIDFVKDRGVEYAETSE